MGEDGARPLGGSADGAGADANEGGPSSAGATVSEANGTGMVGAADQGWELHFSLLQAYHAEHGHCDVPRSYHAHHGK